MYHHPWHTVARTRWMMDEWTSSARTDKEATRWIHGEAHRPSSAVDDLWSNISFFFNFFF